MHQQENTNVCDPQHQNVDETDETLNEIQELINDNTGVRLPPMPQQPLITTQGIWTPLVPQKLDMNNQQLKPPVEIVITMQPPNKARFRYASESAAGGLILGDKKEPVAIRINNFIGKVLIVVSCVDIDDYKAHPYKLTHKGCSPKTGGACLISTDIKPNAKDYQFKNLGILLVKRSETEESLMKRREAGVDPFKKKFHHASTPNAINRKAVRLAFQVFEYLEDGRGGYKAAKQPMACAVSDVIQHEKNWNVPEILHYSHCTVYVPGGLKIFMFCKSVINDVVVEFFEKNMIEKVIWSVSVEPWFKGKDGYIVEAPRYDPPYYDPTSHTDPIKVWFCLTQKETKQSSEPLPLEYLPSPEEKTKRKRLNRHLEEHCKLEMRNTSNSDYFAEAVKWYEESKNPDLTVCEPINSSTNNTYTFCTLRQFQNLTEYAFTSQVSTSHQDSAYHQAPTSHQPSTSQQACTYYQDTPHVEQAPPFYQDAISNDATQVITYPPESNATYTQLQPPNLDPSVNQMSESATSFSLACNQGLLGSFLPSTNPCSTDTDFSTVEFSDNNYMPTFSQAPQTSDDEPAV